MSAGKAVRILAKQSNTMNVLGVLSVPHVLILNQSEYICMYTLYIYIHIYACILLCGYLPNPLYRGPTAPSDKCLAISSANDVKRAKFMFQHDIDIFLYTDMYIHSPIQKHIMYVFTTSFVACACLRFSRLSQCECIFALWQGEGGAAHAT